MKIAILLIKHTFCKHGNFNFLDNLAYGKATHKSSTYPSDGFSPSYAVDGVIAAVDRADYLVSHTQNLEKQFWMID